MNFLPPCRHCLRKYIAPARGVSRPRDETPGHAAASSPGGARHPRDKDRPRQAAREGDRRPRRIKDAGCNDVAESPLDQPAKSLCKEKRARLATNLPTGPSNREKLLRPVVGSVSPDSGNDPLRFTASCVSCHGSGRAAGGSLLAAGPDWVAHERWSVNARAVPIARVQRRRAAVSLRNPSNVAAIRPGKLLDQVLDAQRGTAASLVRIARRA